MQETWVQPWVGKNLWSRAWQPAPVFLPGKFYAQRSLEGYSPWGCKESDMIEQLTHTHTHTHTHTQRVLAVVLSLSHVQLFVTLCSAACQASLSFTISCSLLKLMSIESVMPSNHLILCHPLFLLPSVVPNIRVFPKESHQVKLQRIGASASVSFFPMNSQGLFSLGLTGLISLQSKALSRDFSNATAWKHQFFSSQPSLWSSCHIHTWLLENPMALTSWTFVGKVISLLFNSYLGLSWLLFQGASVF